MLSEACFARVGRGSCLGAIFEEETRLRDPTAEQWRDPDECLLLRQPAVFSVPETMGPSSERTVLLSWPIFLALSSTLPLRPVVLVSWPFSPVTGWTTLTEIPCETLLRNSIHREQSAELVSHPSLSLSLLYRRVRFKLRPGVPCSLPIHSCRVSRR